MYAIIETGGKQYKVQAGDIIAVDKLGAEAGSGYVFDRVLAILDDETATFGSPLVSGAKVTASVIGDGKNKKIVAYKYKSKKGYHRKKGHRQPFTRVRIDAVNPV